MIGTTRRRPRGGFTLIELLVVIAIIGLISAVALPVVLPALNERRVSEAARLLQAVLSGARDAAIRANAPRGIRLLPDSAPGSNFTPDQALASNRFIAIEPAPDYSEGVVRLIAPLLPNTNTADPYYVAADLRVAEVGTILVNTATVLNAPTGWRFNIRQGDKIRFNNSGAYYTVAGPIHQAASDSPRYSQVSNNPERYVCYTTAPAGNALAANWTPEYLSLTNGVDDDGDGWVDESCDGIDNDGDGIIDPGFNGIDDNNNGTIDDPPELGVGLDANRNPSFTAFSEWEQEKPLGTESSSTIQNANYVISRRPVVSPNAAETTLPAGVVIDLTTWNAAAATFANGASPTTTPLPERSRLPVDPFSGFVDIMIDQTGRVVTPGAGAGTGFFNTNSPLSSLPFYHFWITEREGVAAPLWGSATNAANTFFNAPYVNSNFASSPSQANFLPLPQGTVDAAGNPYGGPYLKGERRLVTLFTKTGQIVANSIEFFNASDTSTPYYAAQSGTKESQ